MSVSITIRGTTRSAQSLPKFVGVDFGGDIGVVVSIDKLSPSKVFVDTNKGGFDGYLTEE